MEKKLLAYARQSKKGNSEYTFNVQKKAIKTFAQANGLGEIFFYEEDASAKTGRHEEKTGQKRPVFEEMLNELKADRRKNIENRRYAGLIFFDVSRISRNAKDFVEIEELMQDGYKIYSVRENIIDSPAGLYFFRMAQVEAIYYSERQSSKIIQYRYHKIMKDPEASSGGLPAYGYTFKKKKYQMDEYMPEIAEEFENYDGWKVQFHPINADIVRRIFEEKSKGLTDQEINTVLENEFRDQVTIYNREHRNSFPASIPSPKKISEILHDNYEFRYNGKRVVNFEIRFEEDAKMFNTWDDLKENELLKKGDNTRVFELPDLAIVDEKLHEIAEKKQKARINTQAQKEEGIQTGPIFSNIECSCWESIIGWWEGKWEYYYKCQWARKGTCQMDANYPEKEFIRFFDDELFQYLIIKPYAQEIIFQATKKRREKLKKSLGEWGNQKIQQQEKYNKEEEKHGIVPEKFEEKHKEKMEEIRQKIKKTQEMFDNLDMAPGSTFFTLRKYLTHFGMLDRDSMRYMATLAIKKIVMTEIHDGNYQFKNPKDSRNPLGRAQKIIQEISLHEPFDKIFLYNRYRNNV